MSYIVLFFYLGNITLYMRLYAPGGYQPQSANKVCSTLRTHTLTLSPSLPASFEIFLNATITRLLTAATINIDVISY